MPNLIIDDLPIEVEPGTKVIEAAERLGIIIPRFCFHPALGSVGACRVCAVKFLQGPFEGVQMSCMIDALDGMVISTTDAQAVDFRRHVIEWLMLNHPHDCPVCDEGGHCLLQDMTVAGGHCIRRYKGSKRTHHDQYLGPLLQHEMNRCIQCYRCSRYYQGFAGYKDLGVMRSAAQVYFGRQDDGVLQNPFSGNLADICPTGVYTDKPSRFKGRRWDFERTPSICINCSLGCNVTVSARHREVVRQEARFNDKINGHFICDRGRYGFAYVNAADRPRRAMVGGRPADIDDVLLEARSRLARTMAEFGPQSVAAVGPLRGSLETQAALAQLSEAAGWHSPAFYVDPKAAEIAAMATARLEDKFTVSLRGIEGADVILAVGSDPVNEAPMLALAMRQAVRRGGHAAVIDSRSPTLPFEHEYLPVAVFELDVAVGRLVNFLCEDVDTQQLPAHAAAFVDECRKLPDGRFDVYLQAIARRLLAARQPVVVCGSDIVEPATVALCADVVLLLHHMGIDGKLFYTLKSANAFGAARLGSPAANVASVLRSVERGTVKALVVVEKDLHSEFPDHERLKQALAQLDLLVVIHYLDISLASRADYFLPATTIYETGGLYLNQEGRLQTAPAAVAGGRPIQQTGGGAHPPRQYNRGIPGDTPQEAWRLLLQLCGEQPAREPLLHRLEDTFATPGALTGASPVPPEGMRVGHAVNGVAPFHHDWQAALARHEQLSRDGQMLLVTVAQTFGTEPLSCRSPWLEALTPPATVRMALETATQLQLAAGDQVVLDIKPQPLTLPVVIEIGMAANVLALPRVAPHRMARRHFLLTRNRIKKVDAP